MTTMATGNQRYLVFRLGDEKFGVPLLSVREVIGVPEVTPVPNMPSYFKGIMNLRGQVISVMDMRAKLGLKPNASGESVVVIFDLNPLSIGVIVDSVEYVLNADPASLSDKTDVLGSKKNEYITQIYRAEEGLILFVDISKALSLEDYAALKAA